MNEKNWIDNQIDIITPERVSFSVPICGPFCRWKAAFLDFLIIQFINLGIGLFLGIFSGGDRSFIGLFLVSLFLIEWGYTILLESTCNGQTIGKKIVGIRVISSEGGPIQPAQAIVRNLIRAFEGLIPFFYLPALFSICCSPRFQRLGDLAADTIVVWDWNPFDLQKRWKDKRPEKVDSVLEMLPSRLELSGSLTRLIEDYIGYRQRLSKPRLAEITEPLANYLREKYGLSQETPSDLILLAVGIRLQESSKASVRDIRNQEYVS
jgi:uncharacterized RDD family membrane protein YckC